MDKEPEETTYSNRAHLCSMFFPPPAKWAMVIFQIVTPALDTPPTSGLERTPKRTPNGLKKI